MTDPTTRPARRILAVVTIMRDRGGHYVVDTSTGDRRRTETAKTRDDAIDAIAAALEAMTDEEADRA